MTSVIDSDDVNMGTSWGDERSDQGTERGENCGSLSPNPSSSTSSAHGEREPSANLISALAFSKAIICTPNHGLPLDQFYTTSPAFKKESSDNVAIALVVDCQLSVCGAAIALQDTIELRKSATPMERVILADLLEIKEALGRTLKRVETFREPVKRKVW